MHWLDGPDGDGEISQMQRATITEAQNGLSALIDRVRAGESVLITDRGVPVARLAPAGASADADDLPLARLGRAGIVRRGPGDPGWILDRPPTRTVDGRGISDLVLEDRESGSETGDWTHGR
jgi:prevent-host-death family protein